MLVTEFYFVDGKKTFQLTLKFLISSTVQNVHLFKVNIHLRLDCKRDLISVIYRNEFLRFCSIVENV